MNGFSYIVVTFLKLLVGAIEICMLVRAVLSWFDFEWAEKIEELAYNLTEPVILPVRRLLEKFGVGEGMPIDISFLVTYILLGIASMILTYSI